MDILKIEHIRKSFANNVVLSDINLRIPSGSLTGITGENGCGKTTLLKLITGYYKPDSGSIITVGKLGYCPQECNLFPQLSVRENFKYFGTAYGMLTSEITMEMLNLLQYFDFKQYVDYKVETLSGGTQQKLNLCISLLNKPKLLVLDEPYNGFDWNTYSKFWNYSIYLKEHGCAILVVAHLLTNTEIFDAVYNIMHEHNPGKYPKIF